MPATDNDLNQQNIERFNAIAAEWDTQPRHIAMASAVAEAMRAALAPRGEESLLELGCGTGLITVRLAPHVARIVTRYARMTPAGRTLPSARFDGARAAATRAISNGNRLRCLAGAAPIGPVLSEITGSPAYCVD